MAKIKNAQPTFLHEQEVLVDDVTVYIDKALERALDDLEKRGAKDVMAFEREVFYAIVYECTERYFFAQAMSDYRTSGQRPTSDFPSMALRKVVDRAAVRYRRVSS